MSRFKGKKVAVIGGGLRSDKLPGFGTITCQRFVEEGARVAVVDISLEMATNTQYMIGDSVNAVPFVGDVSDVEGTRALLEKIASAFGGIDILVNNVGICTETDLLDITVEEWDRTMTVNARGPFFAAQKAMQIMIANKTAGVLAFVASDAIKGPAVASVAYGASKGAETTYMRSLARKGGTLNPKVRTFAVCPGPGRTEMTANWPTERRDALVSTMASGQLVEPGEIARTILYGADPEMKSLTGACLHVNGGTVMFV